MRFRVSSRRLADRISGRCRMDGPRPRPGSIRGFAEPPPIRTKLDFAEKKRRQRTGEFDGTAGTSDEDVGKPVGNVEKPVGDVEKDVGTSDEDVGKLEELAACKAEQAV